MHIVSSFPDFGWCYVADKNLVELSETTLRVIAHLSESPICFAANPMVKGPEMFREVAKPSDMWKFDDLITAKHSAPSPPPETLQVQRNTDLP